MMTAILLKKNTCKFKRRRRHNSFRIQTDFDLDFSGNHKRFSHVVFPETQPFIWLIVSDFLSGERGFADTIYFKSIHENMNLRTFQKPGDSQ